MAIVTNTEHRINIPHEQDESDGGPHWVEIRNLSGSEMDEAQQSKSMKVLEQMGHLLNGLKTPTKTPEELEDERNHRDDLDVRRIAYDPDILIKYALLSWSYTDELPSNPGAILDAVTRDWLWDTIVDENTRLPLVSLSGGLS